jgi:hypothetical protein
VSPAAEIARADSLWRCPPALLAALGGGLMLAEALLAALLVGVDTRASSPAWAVLFLCLGGFVALCAAHLLPAAPRSAALLCLAGVTLAGLVHLPLFVSLLLERYSDPSRFVPQVPSLGALLAPLLWWLLVATPLVVAAVLALRGTIVRGEAARGGHGL